MGKVAIIDTRTREVEVYDTEKDSIRLLIRMVQTGVAFRPVTPQNEQIFRNILATLNDSATPVRVKTIPLP